jgi:hypothetical protein
MDLFQPFHGFEPDFDADPLQYNPQQFPSGKAHFLSEF